MSFVKRMFRIMLIPLLLLVCITQWIGTLLHAVSVPVVTLLAGLFTLIAIGSFVFGIGSRQEVFCVLLVSLALRVLPMVSELIIQGIAAVKSMIKLYVFS